MSKMRTRCPWAVGELYEAYHDKEWGMPVHDDRTLFEFLILEGAQAGLSWITILKKRDAYRKAFANFDPMRVAKFDDANVKSLLANEGIVRNRAKIHSAIANAKAFLAIQKEFGSFDRYVWSFVGGKQIDGRKKSMKDITPTTEISDALAKDLRKRGFNFVGSTIMYAFMQAIGMTNDHIATCYRYEEVKRLTARSS